MLFNKRMAPVSRTAPETGGLGDTPAAHTAIGPHDIPSCPVCDTACTNPQVETYTAEEAAAHFCPATRDPNRNLRLTRCIRRLWGADCSQILSCNACGFSFGYPHVGGDGEFYGLLHEMAGYPEWRWEYPLAAQRANTVFPNGGKALDIGAGDGAFLVSLPPNWNRHGVESTNVTRRMLQDRGIVVFRELEEAAERMAGQFQLVTLFQVIEHVAEFRPMLAAVRRLLCPGGLLAVSCPNGDEIPLRERATRYPDMPPNHINKWNPTSIGLALRQCGFEDMQSEREPASFKRIPYSVYLRVRRDAADHPHSLAAQTYRIRSKVIRAQVLKFVGLFTTLKMMPHLSAAKLSVNFITFARAGVAPLSP